MVKLFVKEPLVNEFAGVQDTKVCLIDILTLKRIISSLIATSVDDHFFLRTIILHVVITPAHFDLDSILLLAESFELEKQTIYFRNNHALFLNMDKGIIEKLLGIIA